MQNCVCEKLAAGLRICTGQANPSFLITNSLSSFSLPTCKLWALQEPFCWKVNKHMHIQKYLPKSWDENHVCRTWHAELFFFFLFRKGSFVFAWKQWYSMYLQRKLPHRARFLWLMAYHSTWFSFKRTELLKDCLRTASPNFELFVSVLPCYSLW